MKDNKDIIGIVLLVVLVAALSLAYSYWVATSDLPDWLKFWLL